MALAKDYWGWFPGGSNQGPNQRVGPVIASAGTIAPTHPVHHVSGAAAIATITPPEANFSGFLTLIADGIFTWTAAGNIAVAGTSTAVGRAPTFFYDPNAAKWYPMFVA